MLSTTTEYAIRALANLNGTNPKQAVLGRDLARTAGIPANYMAKIMGQLKRRGIVAAARGRGGGYYLSRPAEQVTLLEIALIFDGDRALPGCLMQKTKPCTESQPCGAHHKWKFVRDSLDAFLRTTTLADLMTESQTAGGAGYA